MEPLSFIKRLIAEKRHDRHIWHQTDIQMINTHLIP
jgi:hypothetical protein